jgi:hypothetical protein
MYPSSDPVSMWVIQGDDASAYEAVGCGSAQIASTVYDLGVGSRGNMDDFRGGMRVRENAPWDLRLAPRTECVSLVGVSFAAEIVQGAVVHNTLWKTDMVRDGTKGLPTHRIPCSARSS